MKTRHLLGGGLALGAAVLTLSLCVGSAWAQDTPQEATRATMRGLFVVVSNVYKYSLNPDAYADVKNHQEIQRMLEGLAHNADLLKSHGGELDPSYDFMRQSLSFDAHQALETFQVGNYVGSRYVISEITQNCLTCHTKLPAQRTFPAGQEFLNEIDAKSLPPVVRAKLQVAARQFSDAMTTYETLMSAPGETPEDLAISDVFENYFRISIGALNDTQRPIGPLERFAGRADMPDNIKSLAMKWVRSLEDLDLNVDRDKELDAAKTLVTDARADMTSASDRSQLVNFIAAISLLHRYIHTTPHDDSSLPEAYYLLGVAETYTAHSYWIAENEFLLAKAIRMDPKSKVAKEALKFLVDYRNSEAATTPARPVPAGTQVDVDALRKLVEK